MKLQFLPIEEQHAPAIAEIYNYYILNSTANFYTQILSPQEIMQSIPFQDTFYPCYMVLCNSQFIGFAYCTHFKPRQAYKHTAEITIYLSAISTGLGLGAQVLKFIHKQAAHSGIRELIAVITASNDKSIKMFSNFGYKSVGLLTNVGKKNKQLLDVAILQFSLN